MPVSVAFSDQHCAHRKEKNGGACSTRYKIGPDGAIDRCLRQRAIRGHQDCGDRACSAEDTFAGSSHWLPVV
jgi:hypothetical protein